MCQIHAGHAKRSTDMYLGMYMLDMQMWHRYNSFPSNMDASAYTNACTSAIDPSKPSMCSIRSLHNGVLPHLI